MELEMNGFRCYKNKVMKLPTKGLVLLSGPSGSGKTSILQAITWCLYGKIRSVECKTNSKTKKMFVRWTIPANTIVSSSKTIVIYRQKHPNLLKVHFLSESSENDLELIDDVAQKRICDLFGTLGVWHLSSYLPQDQFNPLFTSSAAGGLQYLNTIAFHEDNPSETIDKIQENLKTAKTRFDVQQDIFEKNTLEFKRYLSEHAIEKEYASSEEEYHGLITTLKRLKEEILETLSDLYFKEQQTLSRIRYSQERKEKLANEIEKNKEYLCQSSYQTPIAHLQNAEERHFFNQTLSVWIASHGKQKSLEQSYAKQQKLYESLKDVNEITEEEFYEKKDLLKQRKIILEKCAKHNLNLSDKESIDLDRRLGKAILDNQDKLEVYQNMIKAFEDFQQSPHHPEFKKQDILSIQKKIHLYEQSKKQLKCPKCKQSLYFRHGTLEMVSKQNTLDTSNSSVSLKDLQCKEKELLKQEEENHTHQRKLELFEHYKEKYLAKKAERSEEDRILLEEHDKISLTLTQKEIKCLERKIQDEEYILENVSEDLFEDNQELDLEVLRRGLEKKKAKTILENTLSELENISLEYNSSRDKLSKILKIDKECFEHPEKISAWYRQETKVYDEKYKQNIYLEKELESVSDDLVSSQTELEKWRIITSDMFSEEKYNSSSAQETLRSAVEEIHKKDSLEEMLKCTKSQIVNVEHIIEKTKDANEAIKRESKLKEEEKSIAALSERVKNLALLKEIAIDTECQLLEEVSDHINATVNLLSEDIFSDCIHISLNLYKEQKTKKRSVPKVNFTIQYKNCTFSSPQEVSGGERYRLSLLFTLALHKWNNSKILLLDETFSSLDQEIRIECLSAIRKVAPESLVLCVNHSPIEGFYDKSIHLA